MGLEHKNTTPSHWAIGNSFWERERQLSLSVATSKLTMLQWMSIYPRIFVWRKPVLIDIKSEKRLKIGWIGQGVGSGNGWETGSKPDETHDNKPLKELKNQLKRINKWIKNSEIIDLAEQKIPQVTPLISHKSQNLLVCSYLKTIASICSCVLLLNFFCYNPYHLER